MHDNGRNASLLLPSNPNPVPSGPSHPSRHTRIMENLKAAVLLRLSNSYPNKTFSSSQIAAIECRLAQVFPSFNTPTHPTYASMIQNAILELNEEGGSTEDSISEFITKNYEGLPWAHRRYLSHYLSKLRENGEVVCTKSKRYTLPDLICRPMSRKKQLRPKHGRKRKENVIDEDELSGVNKNEVCFEEKENELFGKNWSKRRRSSLVVHEDEELEEKEVIGREEDMDRSNKFPEGRNELLGRDCGDEVGKDSELRQNGVQMEDKGHAAMITGNVIPETQQGAGCKGEQPVKAGSVETAADKLTTTECQSDEARNEVLPSERRTEQQLPLVPPTVEKRLPDECKDKKTAENLQLNQTSWDDNLSIVPVKSVKTPGSKGRCDSGSSVELNLSSIEGNPADLSIVPFEGDTSALAAQKEMKPMLRERRVIVCALPSGVSMSRTRRHVVCRPRKRSKQCQKEPLLLLENSTLMSSVSPVGLKLLEYEQVLEESPQRGPKAKLELGSGESSRLKKSSSQTHETASETTPMISVKEGLARLEMGIQKLHLESSLSGGQGELMFKDDDDFNIPLQQVLQKSGKQRKLKKQLRRQEQNLDNLEAETAALPVGEAISSFNLEACDNRKGRHEDFKPQLSDRLDATSDKHSVENHHEQQGEGRDQGIDLLSEALPIDGECHELGENQEKTRDHGLSSDMGQTAEVRLRDSSQPQNRNVQNEEHGHQNQTEMGDIASCGSEPVKVAILGEKVSPESQASLPREKKIEEAKGCLSAMICEQIGSQQEENQCPVHYPNVGKTVGEHGEENADPLNMSSDQQIKQSEQHHQGQDATSGKTPDLIIEVGSTVCQIDMKKGQEPKNAGHIACLGSDPTSSGGLASDIPGQQLITEQLPVKPDSQCQSDKMEEVQKLEESDVGPVEIEVHVSDQHYQQIKQLKREGRGRPRERKDVEGSLNSHLREQEGLAELASNQHSDQQNEHPKKHGRGRPRKHREVKDSLNSHHQEQERLAELASNRLSRQRNKQPKKDGRGRPRKQKEEIADMEAHLNMRDPLQEESSKPTIQLIKKEVHLSPKKQIKETMGSVAAPVNSHDWKEGRQSELTFRQPVLQQSKEQKIDVRGRPRKQSTLINENAKSALNLCNQEQEGLSGPTTHQLPQQQSKQPKRDGRGRPRKQMLIENEGITATLSLQFQQQEEPSDEETCEHSQQDRINKEDVAAPLKWNSYQQEGLPKPANDQLQGKQKKDSHVMPSEKAASTEECSVAASNLDHEQHSEQQVKQTKTDHHGMPKLEGATFEVEQQEPPVLPVHSTIDASDVLCQPDKKEDQKEMSDQEGGPAGAVNSTPAPLLTEDKSYQQAKVLHEHARTLSVFETPEQLPVSNPILESSVNQPCQQKEEEHIQLHEEKQGMSGNQDKTLKQKSAKSRAVEVPLSSMASIRSRLKRQSESET